MTQVPLYNIGEYLKDLRLSNHLSILKLSKQSGISWRTIDRIEKGDSMTTFQTVQKIHHAMNGPEEVILKDIINNQNMKNPLETIEELIEETIDGIANPDDDNSTYEEDNVILKK